MKNEFEKEQRKKKVEEFVEQRIRKGVEQIVSNTFKVVFDGKDVRISASFQEFEQVVTELRDLLIELVEDDKKEIKDYIGTILDGSVGSFDGTSLIGRY